MVYHTAKPQHWLTDEGLTDSGKAAREEYARYTQYLSRMSDKSFMVNRVRYFLNAQNYWTLPEGYALPPVAINLAVNNVCNLKCKYCDFGQGQTDTFYYKYNVVDSDSRVELSFDRLKQLVDESRWFSPVIRASYREPLLYRHIVDLVAYVKEAGMPFWLLTNGFTLSRHADDLARLGVDSVRLSLDGPQAMHDSICGVTGAYARMIEGVQALIEARSRYNAPMQIGFYYTMTEENNGAIVQALEELDAAGVLQHTFISFHWLLYTTKQMAKEHNEKHGKICGGMIEESTVQSVDISKFDTANMAAQAKEVQKRWPESEGYRIHFRPSFDQADLDRYKNTEELPVADARCRTLWYNFNINPAGEVKSFHHCLLPGVGNINGSSLMDVWNGEAARKQRQSLQQYGTYRGCARCWGVYGLLDDKRREGSD